MKIATIVGARPQFVKEAAFTGPLRRNNEEVLIHTGQHYDYNMSKEFFDELNIPKPDYNLGISGGSHSEMTSRMMLELEKVLLKEEPDRVVVFGDTNSTLAGALTAAKLYIPVCHIEAGGRTYMRTNPEEINRVCTDHISSLLFATSENDLNNLNKEGLGNRSYLSGNIMYDAFLKYKGKISIQDIVLTTLDENSIYVTSEYYCTKSLARRQTLVS